MPLKSSFCGDDLAASKPRLLPGLVTKRDGRVIPAQVERLRPRHLAGRVVRPVAVEPDDAPLDAPARADHPGVLGDGIVDDVPAAVRDFDDAAAETAWNGLRRPRAKGGLAHLLEIEDAQIGRPVHV